jgi:hypothetical protein
VLGRRIILSLAAFAAAVAAVVPAVGVIDSHSAEIAQEPFSRDGSKPAAAHVADPSVGSGWTTVAVPAR